MIRDRLLSFDVRKGSLASMGRDERRGPATMIERSEALKEKKRKMSESQAMLQKNMKPKLSNNMRQKAYWVQNQYQSSMSLPQIENSKRKDNNNRSHNISPRTLRDEHEQKRMSESLNPIAINKEEKLTTAETDGDMKLV